MYIYDTRAPKQQKVQYFCWLYIEKFIVYIMPSNIIVLRFSEKGLSLLEFVGHKRESGTFLHICFSRLD